MAHIDLTIDIETIPDQNPEALKNIAEKMEFKTPSALGKNEAYAELIAANLSTEDEMLGMDKNAVVALWTERFAPSKKLEAAHAEWLKTSFDGAFGQIAVIGWKINNNPAKSIMRNSPESSDEIDLLKRFNAELKKDLAEAKGESKTTPKIKLIGHYAESFDFPFLFKRHVICGVKPCIDFQPSRYSEDLFDTCTKWAGFQGRIKLDTLCKVLGIPSPKENGLDGSKVWEYVQNGRIAEVAEYCEGDVESTHAVYKRLTFQG